MMSNVKLIVLILAFASMSAAQTTVHKRPESSASDMRLSSAIRVVRPSIVQISRRFRVAPAEGEALHLESEDTILGTGFIVDVVNGYVITALHVIRSGERPILLPGGLPSHPELDEMLIGIAMPFIRSKMITLVEGFSNVGFSVVARDERHDLALLKATGQIQEFRLVKTSTQDIRAHPKAAILYLDPLSDGESIAVSGYPLNSNVLITTAGSIASSDALDIKMLQRPGAPPGFTWPDVADSYVADIKINLGDSGGPMYLTRNGAVIGVCLGFQNAPIMTMINGEQHAVTAQTGELLTYNSGLGVVVPAKYVADLLKHNGVKFQSVH